MVPLLPGGRERRALRFEQPSLYRPALPSHRRFLPGSVPSPKGRMHRARRATRTTPLAARPVRRAPRKQQPPDRPSTPEGRQGCHPAPGPRDYSDHAGAPPRPGHRHEGEIGNGPSSIHPDTTQYAAGSQGLGKTMLAKNIAHQAILAGHTALFTTAADLLLNLNGQETARALERRLRHYTRPALLVVDEVGYLAYDARAADLLFQLVPLRAPLLAHHHQPAVQALGHRLPQRLVRRRTDRPADPPRRDPAP